MIDGKEVYIDNPPHVRTPRVAFIGRNPFQFMHVRSLLLNLPNSVFIAEVVDGDNSLGSFDQKVLSEEGIDFLPWDHDKLHELDGVFDVFVCQTPFEGIHKIKKTKLAMIQYGYAKEPYNYGAWRSFADINLVYGNYAASKIGGFSRTAITGNPRYDILHKSGFKEAVFEKYKAVIDPQKKTVLYAPTWGQLSSIDRFSGSVLALEKEYNVLVKSHHNTDLRERDRFKWRGNIGAHYFGAESDIIELIFISDVVISDYSGAIFDAIYCEKPVVLLSENIENIVGEKIDRDSIEYARRDDLGRQIFQPNQIEASVRFALENREKIIADAANLRALLFLEAKSATDLAISAIVNLRSIGRRDQIHGYIRSAMTSLYATRDKLAMKKSIVKKKRLYKKIRVIAERTIVFLFLLLLRIGITMPCAFLRNIKVRDHYRLIYKKAPLVGDCVGRGEKCYGNTDRIIDSFFSEKDFCGAQKLLLQSTVSLGVICKIKKLLSLMP